MSAFPFGRCHCQKRMYRQKQVKRFARRQSRQSHAMPKLQSLELWPVMKLLHVASYTCVYNFLLFFVPNSSFIQAPVFEAFHIGKCLYH
mmetsp:Transcript_29188/g.53340  ORF Transcript_29188/g.53340 Transcript_29188/m.53340 type:complete len:89 (-) Transcript_29188:96-362(-)